MTWRRRSARSAPRGENRRRHQRLRRVLPLSDRFTEAGDRPLEEGLGDPIQFVVIERTLRVVAEDPDDDSFVECAVATGAESIVSRDRHLKKLGCYGDIRIVAPAEFLRLFKNK